MSHLAHTEPIAVVAGLCGSIMPRPPSRRPYSLARQLANPTNLKQSALGSPLCDLLWLSCSLPIECAMSTPYLIDAQGVSLQYQMGQKSVTVLRDVSLQIEAGTTVAIAGPSGSGKTSLLLLLSGLERPDAGVIRLAGNVLSDMSGDELADLRRDQIGIIFQSFHLLPSLTALENVALPLQMADRDNASGLALDMLARVGLATRANHRPSQLSGGEQQRVAIARALVHRPSLLLADEPTGNLDDQTAQSVRELLFQLNQEFGTTLVLVTHDMDFASQCNRVLRLHDGQLQEVEHAVPA